MWIDLTEDKTYQKTGSAKLTRVRDLNSETASPIRVLGIVVDSVSGVSLIQDIYDNVDDAEKMWASSEKELEVGKKYLLIGNVVRETVESEARVRLETTVAFDIDNLDLDLYREAMELESAVIRAAKS